MKKVEGRIKTIFRSGGSSYAIHSWFFVILLSVLCLLVPAKVSAQSSNRWLFVFNTSSAMRDRAPGAEAVAADLLKTGMHGNLRNGDTIGIWTYDKQLRANEVPLLTWDSTAATPFAQHAVAFLNHHPYQNTAAFGDVLANMLRVVKDSEVITVVLVSDGSDAFFGTPFDANITAFYKTNYQAQKKGKMPVITVLRGEQGKITTNTLSLAPWPVDIPAMPLPVVAKAVAVKPVADTKPKSPVPSLVIIGKKAETTFNPPADISHAEPEAAPEQKIVATTEASPVVEKAALVAKVEEKPTVVVSPTPATLVVTNPPLAAVETPRTVQSAETAATVSPTTNEAAAKPATPVVLPVVETAPSTPTRELFSVRNIAIVSVVFTLLVCTLLILTAKNARNATQASLITQSLERGRK